MAGIQLGNNTIVRHLITPEYPPQSGGVSDYVVQLAEGLAKDGEEVHVWYPGTAPASRSEGGVNLHADLGRITPEDLRTVGEKLDRVWDPVRRLPLDPEQHVRAVRW